jgi:4-diphosphocytidyl-2-C-methyl-D-erythritol kinase
LPERHATWLALRAPAKVNLVLRVLGRREDGYHELETVFHALALGDLLLGRLAEDGLELTIDSRCDVGSPVEATPENLVLRAARAFYGALGREGGARFHLRKRIPAGGGLGGGSSDAAAALRILQHLHAHPLAEDELHELARGLGADVPYFLCGGTQLGLGRGDILAPIPEFPGLELLLLLPPIGTSTALVYKNSGAELTMTREDGRSAPSKALAYKALAVPTGLQNDLEVPAFALHHELQRLREVVAARYPDVRMSGSGSTLFLARPRGHGHELDRAREELSFLNRHGVYLLRTCSGPSSARSTPRAVTYHASRSAVRRRPPWGRQGPHNTE